MQQDVISQKTLNLKPQALTPKRSVIMKALTSASSHSTVLSQVFWHLPYVYVYQMNLVT